MSRHEIAARDPNHIVTVGWDNPMQTFFAQVERQQDDDDPRDPILFWLGTGEAECITPYDLVAPLAPYAVLDAETIRELNIDRFACLDRRPTPLQRFMRSHLPHP